MANNESSTMKILPDSKDVDPDSQEMAGGTLPENQNGNDEENERFRLWFAALTQSNLIR